MGWVAWEQAWQESLYGDRGFYRSPAGPAAHFATSAQGIPGGGALLGAAVIALADQYGVRQIVDFACGRGELAGQIHTLAPDLQITAVDVVARPTGLSRGIEWVYGDGGACVPDVLRDLSDVLVLAHEWLDVVPCPVLESDGRRLRIVEVDDSGAERLGDDARPADLAWTAANWPDWAHPGSRVEVGRSRAESYAALRARIGSGVLVTADYGHLRHHRPANGTLTGYRDGTSCAPRPDGSTDITAHVAMDTLGAPEVTSQQDLFSQLGIRPTPVSIDLARTDPPAYLKALAARSSYTALTAPGGLGDFWWTIDPVRPAALSRPPGAPTPGSG